MNALKLVAGLLALCEALLLSSSPSLSFACPGATVVVGATPAMAVLEVAVVPVVTELLF
jgi:hypothetical protein